MVAFFCTEKRGAWSIERNAEQVEESLEIIVGEEGDADFAFVFR
jgi:hypothetical protein